MFQAFTGTYDSIGVRSLRVEDECVSTAGDSAGLAHFWAVIDSNDMPSIVRAIELGERRRALKLISDCSVSMGAIPAE